MTESKECERLLHSLGEYVDGELSEDLCAEIERHLLECHNCQVVVNTLRKTIELYHEEKEQETLPPEVGRRLYMRLNLEDYLRP